ncbi:MAG: alanine racemase [bacterium]|nr:alanine racemase [bacterium]
MINLYDILEAANGQLFGEPGAQLFTDFCFDPRMAGEGQLYVALKTDRPGVSGIAGDHPSAMQEAVQRGASGILCSRPPEFDTKGESIILVKDAQTALMKWVRYMLVKFGTTVIGVAGSSGKSVTVEAIRQVLATRYPVVKTFGAYEGRQNLALTVARLAPEDRFMVAEMNATQPGEMGEMVEAAQPTVGVVTHIGYAYAERFETLERLTQENGLLVEKLPARGQAILNHDDDRVREMATKTDARPYTIGIEGFGADMIAYNIVLDTTRTGFDLRVGDQRFVGRWTPLLGKHQLYSVLCALMVGMNFEVPMNDALRAVTELQPMPGRMNPLPGINGSLLVDASYDADPQSTLSALDWLRAVTDRQHRAVFVLGDMDNLGSLSQRGHRIVGQRAAEFVDLFVAEGKEAAIAGRAALDQGMDRKNVCITHGILDTVTNLKEDRVLGADDVVLIKGGPSSRMELVARALLANAADSGKLPRADRIADADLLLRPTRPSWVEIDLDALAGNVRGIKRLIGDEVSLFSVVKADGYGHGAQAVARTALLNGAEYLAVASINEALELRDAGIDAPFLVMSYVPPQAIRSAVRQNITVTLYDLELARAFDRAAREVGGKLRTHVKVDTGMGRLGVLGTEAVSFFRSLMSLSNIEIEGIYTHFSTADSDDAYVEEQIKRFKGILIPLRAAGFTFKYVHAANSAAVLRHKAAHFNAVRVGLAMYGLPPGEAISLPSHFKPVMTWKSMVAQVKTLPPGHPIGYGNTYITQAEEKIAVLPVGYSDGFRRAPANWGKVLIQGQFAPIRGRVSMEKTVVDVSHLPNVQIGDEVVLLGAQGDRRITADDIAAQLGTINYEIVTSILARASRR